MSGECWYVGDFDCVCGEKAFYSMANPAAAPMAATTASLFQLRRFAAPEKAAVGAGEVKVPLEDGETTPVEALVGTWIWPSVICLTGVTAASVVGTEVATWTWPSVICLTGATVGTEVATWTWPSVICWTGATVGTEVATWTWPSVICLTGATVGTEVATWTWPSVICLTGATVGTEVATWTWPSVICLTGAGAEVGAWSWPSEICLMGVAVTAWICPSGIWEAPCATTAVAKAKETMIF